MANSRPAIKVAAGSRWPPACHRSGRCIAEPAMDPARLRASLRFDGAAWRRFAELGCVYGPEWWKRLSPPAIAAVIFGIAVRSAPRCCGTSVR